MLILQVRSKQKHNVLVLESFYLLQSTALDCFNLRGQVEIKGEKEWHNILKFIHTDQ